MKKGTVKTLIIVAVVLALILGAMIWGLVWFRNNHYFVEGTPYPKDAESLNLRGEEISVAHYNEIRDLLPDCVIYWDVPFQGGYYADDTKMLTISTISDEEIALLEYFPSLQVIDANGSRDYAQLAKLREAYPELQVAYTVPIDGVEYPQDTTEVTVTKLTDEDVALLAHLPALTAVKAEGCTDYPQLVAAQENHPDVAVTYSVTIFGKEYPESTTELTFNDPDIAELTAQLGNLTKLEKVHIVEPTVDAASLVQLREAFPNIAISWEKTILGQKHTTGETEFDFSGMTITTGDVEAAMKYFPDAEKVIMSDCGIDNETMAAFREKMRAEYKVVWTVIVTGVRVRTDVTIFHSSAEKVCLVDERSYDLYYCEDIEILDIGHSYVKYIEWIRGMPNLQYLILADNWIMDISPLADCKKLVYCELFMNVHLKDLTPLQGCTALKDLNVADVSADLTPLAEMPWLENLWVNMNNPTQAERDALAAGLPNTNIVIDNGFPTGGGWRQVPGYYKMRNLMGLPALTW